MGEFELIRQFFMPLARLHGPHSIIVGPGDDCAIQRVPSGSDLVFSLDTLVEGVHFPFHYRPDYLGWRALAVATSDLAAMGADPTSYTLALTLPEADESWLRGFACGLGKAADAFGLVLAGGDTTRGPLALSLQVHGLIPRGAAILRSGARPGDLVAVSGTLGDAGAALDYLGAQACSDPQSFSADEAFVLKRYHHPEPRLELGAGLRGLATAAIDISDGLLADLSHILEASSVGANIEVARIPVSAALKRLKGTGARDYALHSGDDYELCVTIPEANWTGAPPSLKQQFTVIGVIEEAPGLRLDGAAVVSESDTLGFDHFRRKS
ncbi:thiamine-phosphate kinase [Marinobacter sp. F3R11]|uniref:thiamine-phosphate kinase n=1 Tax=Marinobacter sp. F3R11 TaxID=2267231 RepID=UPI000DE9318E|nr:thiamine-phosphate kinase [Marinobacter sp. F3R11]RBW48180.1 thiamine-phosphate kinase [Marinobacter sp. F3R11]